MFQVFGKIFLIFILFSASCKNLGDESSKKHNPVTGIEAAAQSFLSSKDQNSSSNLNSCTLYDFSPIKIDTTQVDASTLKVSSTATAELIAYGPNYQSLSIKFVPDSNDREVSGDYGKYNLAWGDNQSIDGLTSSWIIEIPLTSDIQGTLKISLNACLNHERRETASDCGEVKILTVEKSDKNDANIDALSKRVLSNSQSRQNLALTISSQAEGYLSTVLADNKIDALVLEEKMLFIAAYNLYVDPFLLGNGFTTDIFNASYQYAADAKAQADKNSIMLSDEVNKLCKENFNQDAQQWVTEMGGGSATDFHGNLSVAGQAYKKTLKDSGDSFSKLNSSYKDLINQRQNLLLTVFNDK